MTTTTWNPSDKSAQVTLSNSNLTATVNASQTNQGVRSTTSKSSGKWYAEFNNCFFSTVPSAGTRGGIGIADSTYTLTSSPSQGVHGGILQEPPGLIINNSTAGVAELTTPIGTSVVVGIAVDVTNALLWFTEDGTHWNNGATANPATGVGGYGITTMGPAIFLAAWLRWGSSGTPYDTATLNVGGSAYSFSVPSGFTSWDSPVVTGTFEPTGPTDTMNFVGGVLGGVWASNETDDIMAAVGGAPYGPWASNETADSMALMGYPQLVGVWSSIDVTDMMSMTGFGATATFFDPTTASPGVDFQADNLTIVNEEAFGNLVGAKSNTSHTSGKYYAEFATRLTANNCGVGIGNASATFAGWGNGSAGGILGDGPAANGAGIFQYMDGTIWINGIEQSNWSAASLVDAIVSVAIDLDNQLIWFRVNGGHWNGVTAANPANGIASPRPPINQPQAASGGYDIAGIAGGPIYLWAQIINAYDAVTLNAGATTFAYAVPSGFTAWNITQTPIGSALALDGYATSNVSEVVGNLYAPLPSGTITLSTTQPNDVIVLGVVMGSDFNDNATTVDHVTSSSGLVWKRRNQRWQTGGTKSGVSTTITNGLDIEVWWAHAPAALSGEVITVYNKAPAGGMALAAFGVSGANYTTPWDTHTQAGGYVDNIGSINYFPAQAQLHTKAADAFLFGLHGDSQTDDGITQEPWSYVASVSAQQHNGMTSFASLVYQIVEEPQIGTDVVVGRLYAGSPVYAADSMMFDSIVSAGETGTDNEIVWFWDPAQASGAIQLSTGNSLQLSYSSVNFNLMVIIEVAIMSASGLGEVTSISESQGSLSSSGFERRSRTFTSTPLGPLAVEIWWGWMPMYTEAERPNNDIITINTLYTSPGDIVGAIMFGLSGATGAFGLGDPFWDVNPALPATNNSAANSPPPYATDISTTIPSDLVVAWAANNSEPIQGFTDPFVTLVQNSPSTVLPTMQLTSNAPPLYTGFEYQYVPGLITNETAEFLQTPEPNGWIVIADAIPVGPPQPPSGTMHISDPQDKFTHTGNYTGIGIASPSGWVGAPENHGVMAAVEHEDINGGTPNLGYSPFLGEGWLGGVAAHATWASTEGADQMALYGWVLGFGITGQMGAAEAKDRLASSNRSTVTGTLGAVEIKDRWASAGLVLPPGHIHPTAPTKRRLLIIT